MPINHGQAYPPTARTVPPVGSGVAVETETALVAWRVARGPTGSNVKALDGIPGEFDSLPASPDNHGVARTLYDGLGFAYDDGTPYVPVGTTSYAW